MELRPTHFHDELVEPIFTHPPALEKSPPCPDGFTWQGVEYRVVELLEEWRDYARRGRMGKNMRPSHAGRAAVRGSWGVGRFHFRVRVDGSWAGLRTVLRSRSGGCRRPERPLVFVL